ncbi:MAG: heme-binding protein [Methylococcales bacterium]|nr:heme-binding protein [Methylococcales bacterium]
MKKLITVLTTIFLTGCSVFGIRTADQPSYEVLNDYGHIQIRHYPALLVAETEIVADYKNASNQGFQRLAGYIFGNNKKQQTLAMTAPVIQKQQTETLAMTAPVIQQKSENRWLMAFVLPKDYSITTAPIPNDKAVTIKELTDKKVAVVQYTGSLCESSIEKNADTLSIWLNQQGFKALSPARSAAYDPPWTLPFLRHNEVHIDIE